MNLAELSSLDIADLKKINYKKLFENLKKRQDIIIDLTVILVTLFVCVNIFGKRQQEISDARAEIPILEKKIKAIEKYNHASAELNKFKNAIPAHVPEDFFINEVTNFAVSRNVQIKSFSPAKKQKTEFYDLTSIVLNVSIKNYRDLWLFIHDLEESHYFFRVDSFKGNIQTNYTRRQKTPIHDEEAWIINMQLEIASININNE